MELSARDVKYFSSTTIIFGMVIDGVAYVHQMLSFKKTASVPVMLSDAYPEYSQSNYDVSLKYGKIHVAHQFLLSLYTTFILLFIIHWDGLVFCWDSLQMANTFLDIWPHSWSINSRKNMSFATVICLLKILLQFPMDLCKVILLNYFAIPLSGKSIGRFIKQWCQYSLLELLAMPLLCGPIMYIVKKLDSDKLHGISKLMFVISLLFLFWIIYPTFVIHFILKIFFKTKMFPNGRFKNRILELTSRHQYPFKCVYVVSGKNMVSKNAFFYGFLYYRKLVFWKALLAQINEEEGLTVDMLEAVAAHELGHWYLNHSMWTVTIQQISIAALCFANLWLKNCKVIYEAFGFQSEISHNALILPGLFIINMFMLNFFIKIFELASNAYQRKLEYDADAFAAKQGLSKNLKAALVKVDIMNGSGFPNYSKIYSMLKRTHPTTVQRINYIDYIQE